MVVVAVAVIGAIVVIVGVEVDGGLGFSCGGGEHGFFSLFRQGFCSSYFLAVDSGRQ